MFNFDFQKTEIYRAVKVARSPVFAAIKVGKIIFLTLSIIFIILFFTSTFGPELAGLLNGKPLTNISFDYNFLLGFALIFFNGFIFCLLIMIFVNIKLKNPKLAKMTSVSNLAKFLDFKTTRALHSTMQFCKKTKIFPVNSTVFLYFLLKENSELSFALSRLLLDKKIITEKLKEYFAPQKFKDHLSVGVYSEKFEQSIKEALKIAESKGHKRVTIGDVLSALSMHEPILGGFLLEADLRPEDMKNTILWQEQEQEKRDCDKRFWDYERLSQKGSIGRGFACGYTITLDEYATDCSHAAFKEGITGVIGYETEIEQAEMILTSPAINNVLLVGQPGVGVKSVVNSIALKSISGQSSSGVNYQRVMELRIPQLLAQLQSAEEVEDVLDKIFREVTNAGNIILVIDEFHNFVGGESAPGTINIAGLLSSYLNLPEFQLIAITSYSGLHKRIEENPSILNLFSKVEVKEPSVDETLRILQKLAPSLERKYNTFISYPAISQAVDLSDKYIANIPFPKKAKEVLEETTVRVSATKDTWVLPKHVDMVVSQKTEIPVGKIEVEEKEVLLNLEDLIHKRIINQNEAVKEISTSLRRARAKLKKRKGPMGDFLFLGPTGVGKTETAKALSSIYFGSEDKIVRLDMSEFQTKDDIPRLIGSSGQEGLLTTPIRENPFSLLLLDEIEKAHPNILNLFLQVLDEGHITDGLGRKVDFKNTIIIATSNAGYKIILEELKNDLDFSEIRQKLLDEIFNKAIFRPEFINRFDAVVIFSPLSEENLLDIAHLMLAKIQEGLKEKNIDFIISEELKQKVVELGYDVTFGARNLQRVIQDKVENPLAEALLRGDVKKGDRIMLTAKRFEVKLLEN
ncbi:MAG: ATP-dependent Clp protease ATP-binding subunit [Patescibacteria group bacterium]|nr:ATP-dependent Clp protease ATP-binding subunit [Patescibacteria group bacterium]